LQAGSKRPPHNITTAKTTQPIHTSPGPGQTPLTQTQPTQLPPPSQSKGQVPITEQNFVMLSVVEWEHLTTGKKDLHHTMRDSWLSSYSKASHTVLQHWLWRFLKKQTQTFAPLHKVFAKIKVDQPDSGTSAWTEIFFLHPVTGASIVHKLLASGLKTCLGFKDDSTAASTAYIVSVNNSASQLSHVQPMTVPDFYSLVTLMGLYL
jgi:hypothetical protein